MPDRLKDKVAIVTGASSGIGRAIAFAYSAEGAHVVCADIRPNSRFESHSEESRGTTHDRITEKGGKAIFVTADTGDAAQVEALVAKAVQEYGRLDIMVNNAGISFESSDAAPVPVWEVSEERWDTTQRINSTGVFFGIKYAAAQMIRQEPHANGDRGWIINTASILGLVGTANTTSYCASKGAVVNLTRAAAMDCAPQRIHVNAIGPGYTESSMTAPLFQDPELRGKLLEAHPFRGLGVPDDLARACVFLASEDAAWVSGHTLPVDGGYTAR